MKKISPRIVFSAIAAIAAGSSTPALACSCAKLSYAQAMSQTPIVFEGRVLRVRREGANVYADVEMSRVLKGSVPRLVEVGTPASSAACGYAFKTGERLTVGVRLAQQMFSTNVCTMGPLNPSR